MSAREEIMRLMREEFDPHPNYELPAGQWDDNADDVADKIIAAALSESHLHISDAWRVLKKWLADRGAAMTLRTLDLLVTTILTGPAVFAVLAIAEWRLSWMTF